MSKNLTPKQSRFVDEYLTDLNATQAAIRAGYSEKSARAASQNNMSNYVVAEAVQQRMNERSKRTEINADFVLNGIMKNISRCEQGEPVRDRSGELVMIETEDGLIAPAYKYDASNALKGYELIGKHLKLFTDKHEHAGPGGGPIQNAVTFNFTGVNADSD